MTADDWSSRLTALALGARYVARENAPGFGTKSFDAGERLQLKRVGYSPYDSSHVYTFETGDGGEKSYGLHDDRPIALLRSVFELNGHTADRG